MSSPRFRFTPSVLDGDTLDSLFVAREGALEDAMTRIRAAGVGEQRAHKLFVGPRGAGKTHLIAVVHHRVQRLVDRGLRVQLAWLLEDPWDIAGYDDLLSAVLDAVEAGLPRDAATAEREAALREAATARGPIVVLIENLDRVLAALGLDGQQRLRALLENHRPMLLIATTTRLTDDLTAQPEPFYGFFDVTVLAPFTIVEARAMLIKLAERDGNAEQLAALDRPETAGRLAAIAHLAGGQPRIWALLADGLNVTTLPGLVTDLVARVDDLTPYYQEQLARLSANEVRLVRRFAADTRPLTVKDVAEQAGIDQRSAARTVTDLRRRGWLARYESPITAMADGRLSYYRLAEPLARLAFQVKESRGRPVQLVVEFIAAWFQELRQAELATGGAAAEYLNAATGYQPEASFLSYALAKAPAAAFQTSAGVSHPSTGLADLLAELDDALIALEARKPGPLMHLPASIIELVDHALVEGKSGRQIQLDVAFIATTLGLDWRGRLDRFAELGDPDLLTLYLATSAVQETMFGTVASAELAVGQLIDVVGDDHPYSLAARQRLIAKRFSHDIPRAVTELENLLADASLALGPDHLDVLVIRANLAIARGASGARAAAAQSLADVLPLLQRTTGPDSFWSLVVRRELCACRARAGLPVSDDLDALVADFVRVLGPGHPDTVATRLVVAALGA